MRARTKKGKGESKALNIMDFQNAVQGKNLYRDGALVGEATKVRRIAGKNGASFSVIVQYGGTHFCEVFIGPRKVMEELAQNGSTSCFDEDGKLSHTFAVKERRR